jgi:hypothetical protein
MLSADSQSKVSIDKCFYRLVTDSDTYQRVLKNICEKNLSEVWEKDIKGANVFSL